MLEGTKKPPPHLGYRQKLVSPPTWPFFGYKTRLEVSKLTPENKINSHVTKLSPAESSEETNRLTDISENFKPVYKNPMNVSKILSKVAHLELESF